MLNIPGFFWPQPQAARPPSVYTVQTTQARRRARGGGRGPCLEGSFPCALLCSDWTRKPTESVGLVGTVQAIDCFACATIGRQGGAPLLLELQVVHACGGFTRQQRFLMGIFVLQARNTGQMRAKKLVADERGKELLALSPVSPFISQSVCLFGFGYASDALCWLLRREGFRMCPSAGEEPRRGPPPLHRRRSLACFCFVVAAW